MSILFSKSLKLPEGLHFQELENGETVFLNINNESYFGLDEIGSDIWKELQSSKNIETAYKKILKKYEVEPEILKKDIEELIPKLINNGILEYS